MKKRNTNYYYIHILMKVSFPILLLFLVTGISYAHPGSAQELLRKKVSFTAKDESLKSVLNRLEKSTAVRFTYTASMVRDQKVTIRSFNQPLEELLKEMLEPLRIKYSVSGDFVILERVYERESESSAPVGTDEEEPAPDRKVSGRVTDESGGTLPGVNILVKGTTQGTATNADGEFTLSIADEQAVLVFSFVGYASREVTVGNRTSIEVMLEVDEKALEEVVVVGYGVQKKSTLTGAIASIKTEDILKSPTSNVTNSMTGRMPGVFVTQRSGKPGSNQGDIFIRGRATTGSSAPLVIVDGAERQSFGDIDPNEIETISVLKDASATALFGIKGGNGVILITTKVGKEGKPRIAYSGNAAIQTYTDLPKTLDAYQSAILLNEAYANIGGEPKYTQDELLKFKNHSDPLRYPDFNWFDFMTRKYFPQTQHNINVSGGTKKAKYFVSAGYLFEDGLFKKFDNPYGYTTTPSYNRYNFRSNVDLNLTSDLSFSIKLGGRLEHRYSPAGHSGQKDYEMEYLISRLHAVPAYGFLPTLPDGRFMENPSAGTNLINPLGLLTRYGYFITQNNGIESTIALDYKLDKVLNGLSFRTQYAYDTYFISNLRQQGSFTSYYINKETDQIVKGTTSGSDNDIPLGAIATSYDGSINYNWQSSLNYVGQFGEHGISGLVLFQRQAQKTIGAQPQFASQGLVLRATYNYQDRYFAEFNGAYNGSENFAAGKRYGFFPAVSAGWNIGNEAFLKPLTWIDHLKIRGSYGKIGFDKIGGNRFLYLEEYNTTTTISGNPNTATQFGLPTSIVTYPAVIHSRIGNPFITWEKSTKRNIGLESSFLNAALVLNFDLFDERRTDILLNRLSGLAAYGEAYPSVNLGEVYNKGYEIELRHHNRIGDVEYGISAQFSHATNRIINLDEPQDRPDYQKIAGYRIGQFRGYQTDGFYQSQTDIDNYYPNSLGKPIPGDLKYRDFNGDGVISADDIAPIGYSSVPEYTYSLEPSLNWKGMAFSVMFQGVTNVSTDLQFDQRVNAANQMYEHLLGRWTPENAENATWPALQPAIGGNFMSYAKNDFLQTDASYLKIRNVMLSYQLPAKFNQLVGTKNFRVSLSCQNLYTWSKVLYTDPENIQGRSYGGAINAVYPTSRIYNLGINVEL